MKGMKQLFFVRWLLRKKMNLRNRNGMVETLFDLIDALSVTFDAVKVGLNIWMNKYNFIPKQSQHPTRLQSAGP